MTDFYILIMNGLTMKELEIYKNKMQWKRQDDEKRSK